MEDKWFFYLTLSLVFQMTVISFLVVHSGGPFQTVGKLHSLKVPHKS